MRGGRLPVRLFGMLCSLCMITPLLVLGSGAMRLCRPVVVISCACMAVITHSTSLFLRGHFANSREGCRCCGGGKRRRMLMSLPFRLNRSTELPRH